MNKPKGMSDEDWGKYLDECARGGPFEPPPLWVSCLMWGLIIGFIVGVALWH